MTTTDREVADYHAAGALADELPYWGWLSDERTCLTRRGELVTLARLTPTVVDGHTPEQLDAVLSRWQRMLSGIDARTRMYFYLLRRPATFPDADTGLSAVADLGQRKRRAFLASRIQQIETYLAWCYDPKLSTAAAGRNHAPWWKHYVQTWMKRRRNPNEAIYFREQIEDAARFRQQVDASRTLVADLTPLDILTPHEGSRVLAELVNRPGRASWEGATGSGMNWRLATSELEAERRHLRLDGEPVILYSLLSPPARATANLLNDLYRLDSVMTVTLEWRPWDLDAARRKIRGAQRHYFSKRYSMMAHVQETEGTASAMVDSAADVESGRLGNALVELETQGIAYGDLALTIALHGELEQIERLGGDILPHLRGARREGDPRRVRPAPRVVLPTAGATPKTTGPIRLRIGRRGGVPCADLRPTDRRRAQPAPGPGRARHPRNPMADAIFSTTCFTATSATHWSSGRPARGKVSRSIFCSSKPCSTTPASSSSTSGARTAGSPGSSAAATWSCPPTTRPDTAAFGCGPSPCRAPNGACSF